MKFHFFNLLRGIKQSFNDKEVRILLVVVFASLILGAIVYHYFEGWSFFDSVYFSVITLTTIGYGDLYPKTFIGKLFTIFYVFIGIGIIFLFINRVAANAVKEHPAIKVIENKPSIQKQIKKEIKKEKQKIEKELEKEEKLKKILKE